MYLQYFMVTVLHVNHMHVVILCKFISLENTYSTAQLQGNEYTRVTREKLAHISRVLARILASQGAARIQVCAKL